MVSGGYIPFDATELTLQEFKSSRTVTIAAMQLVQIYKELGYSMGKSTKHGYDILP